MLLWISGSLTVIVFTSLEFICGVGLMEERGCCKWSVHIAKPRNNSLFLSAQCWQEWQLLQVPLEKAESAVHTSLIASHLHYLHLETVWRVEKCPVTALVGLVSTETNWQHVPSDCYIAPTTDISKRPFSPRRLPENVQLNSQTYCFSPAWSRCQPAFAQIRFMMPAANSDIYKPPPNIQKAFGENGRRKNVKWKRQRGWAGRLIRLGGIKIRVPLQHKLSLCGKHCMVMLWKMLLA